MARPSQHDIKREQKKALFLREISTIIQALSQDEKDISKVYVTRVDLSADTGICFVYFATYPDAQQSDPAKVFESVFPILKLYKPSMRSTLASTIKMRYTPNLVFLFDKTKEKERKINDLLDKVHEDLVNAKD